MIDPRHTVDGKRIHRIERWSQGNRRFIELTLTGGEIRTYEVR